MKLLIPLSLELRVSTSSTIIQEIEATRQGRLASLAFYSYDFRDDQKKDLNGLLTSVLCQLCDQSNSYYDNLSSVYSAHRHARKVRATMNLHGMKELLELPDKLRFI